MSDDRDKLETDQKASRENGSEVHGDADAFVAGGIANGIARDGFLKDDETISYEGAWRRGRGLVRV